MIVGNRASLSVYSDVRSAADVSATLGLEPHESAEAGDPTRAAISGMILKPEFMTYQRSWWSYTADKTQADPEDETGFGSLRVLVDVLRVRAEAIAALRPDCETIIWWSGDSDSSQGGFVMPADLLRDLALLGCDLYGTAFLAHHEEA